MGDARGHGIARSTPIPGSFEPLGDDVAALLDVLDVHRVHVVGHTWGGQIAQRFALHHPDRLSRLSLVCTRSTPFPALPSSGGQHARHWVRRSRACAAAMVLSRSARGSTRIRQAGPELAAGGTGVQLGGALDLIAGFDVLDDLPQVSVPVDVVCVEGTPASLETPKSATFTRPSRQTRMFSGLTSRWITPHRWACARPRRTCSSTWVA